VTRFFEELVDHSGVNRITMNRGRFIASNGGQPTRRIAFTLLADDLWRVERKPRSR
jgi:hypothetical protein